MCGTCKQRVRRSESDTEPMGIRRGIFSDVPGKTCDGGKSLLLKVLRLFQGWLSSERRNDLPSAGKADGGILGNKRGRVSVRKRKTRESKREV